MKFNFTIFFIVMITSLFSETSSEANDGDKVVESFINLMVSDRVVTLKDYKNFRYIDLETEFQFEVMRCRANGWNPYSDRCSSFNHLYHPRVNSFFIEWVKERFSTSGQDHEIISSVFVKHAANIDDFWLVEVLIGEYIFILERYTPRSDTGDLILLKSAYKKDGSITYDMNPPSSCHSVYAGTYDFKVNDEMQAILDLPTKNVANRRGTGSISTRGYHRTEIDISWAYSSPDIIKIESKNQVNSNALSNTLRRMAKAIDKADLTLFEARSTFALYADCKHGVINRMYFYSNKDILFFERRTTMPDIINDPQTLLYNAVQEGDITAVRRLLKTEVDIDKKIQNGHTLLTRASFRGYTEIAQALIDAGADIKADGGMALQIAEKKGYVDIIQILKNAEAK